MAHFLDLYEPLDVIGNGSFGIIRKVRRKSDNLIFARKELNFERMSERDRKQIVAEVNILKDLNHEHIVRYHDRYVDRDAGILYIIMEYCGGGDLSTVIKQAAKQNRPIAEDIIWNYFMQILLALHHCHHPNGHGRSGSGSGAALIEGDAGSSRRPQILHRDLKPDNVFLDESNNVKLGDFGLSKALNQASFANTYVGTPYYMSPELMQEKAYDSKSDIWSLGCLIYELCALKPPFHEAKTHNELSILIRNGRIPPLPRGYSQSLFAVIKAMLNLNPAMRPSAAQLLQHERLELVFKVAETEKMLTTVKAHKNAMVAREREVMAREQAISEREQHITSLFAQKDTEIANLQRHVTQLQHQVQQAQHAPQITQHDVDVAVKRAVARREEELRVLVIKREEEVAAAMAKREEEIMEAVRKREAEVCEAWAKREAEIRQEVEVSIRAVEERIAWIGDKEAELAAEEDRLETLQAELEVKTKELSEAAKKGRTTKAPLEDVRNTIPEHRPPLETPATVRRRPKLDATPKPHPTPKVQSLPALETPITRPSYTDYLPSAMKGVVLTATGETLATPSPAELVTLFNSSPKVGLNFGKIFDFETDEAPLGGGETVRAGVGQGGIEFPASDDEDEPPSPSVRKEKEWRERVNSQTSLRVSAVMKGVGAGGKDGGSGSTSRLRRPSIRRAATSANTGTSKSGSGSASGGSRPGTSMSVGGKRTVSGESASSVSSSSSGSSVASTSNSTANAGSSGNGGFQPKPLPHPHLPTRSMNTNTTVPKYDLRDEENLPSPFLKRVERMGVVVPTPANSTSASNNASSTTATTLTATTKAGSTSTAKTSSLTTGTTGTGVRPTKKRPSTGNLLRTVAAANNSRLNFPRS